MPYYDHNDRTLFYEIRGNGVPVVFLHGSLGSARKHFGQQLDSKQLQQKLKMIAPDLRGFAHSAKSTWWGETITVQEVVDDLYYLIHHELELNQPFYICGYSLGGIATLEYVNQHPNDILGVILVSTLPRVANKVFVLRNKPRKHYFERKNANIIKRSIWSIIKRYRRFMTKKSLQRRARKKPNYHKKWDNIDEIPKILIYGKNDTILPEIAFQQLKNCFPEANILELDADHGITHEKALIFNEMLLNFIFAQKK